MAASDSGHGRVAAVIAKLPQPIDAAAFRKWRPA